MNPRFLRICLPLLAALLGISCASRFPRAEPPPRSVLLDHRIEILEESSPELRCELKIPLQQLIFRKLDGLKLDGNELDESMSAGLFRADLRLTCQARNRESGDMRSLVINDSVERRNFQASRQADDFYERTFSLQLGPGSWEIETLIFTRVAGPPWRKLVKLDVPSPENGDFFLQGPFWDAEAGEADFPIFFSGGHQLGEDRSCFIEGFQPKLNVSCRYICWDEAAREGEMILSLEDRQGRLMHYDGRKTRFDKRQVDLSWDIPLGRLDAGVYRLRIEFVTEEESREALGVLNVGLTRTAFGRNWFETLKLIQPVAEQDELTELEEALPGRRRELWRAFWERHDPNGAAPGNIFRETLCRRASEANTLFGTEARHGFASDRGQVYIELGPPDMKESYIDDSSLRMILIWKYIRLGRTFWFDSPQGFDDYSLVRVTG